MVHSQEKNLQVGSLSGQKIELNIDAMSAKGLGLAGTSEAQYYTDTVEASHGKVSFTAESTLTVPTTQPTTAADIFSNYTVGTDKMVQHQQHMYIYGNNELACRWQCRQHCNSLS